MNSQSTVFLLSIISTLILSSCDGSSSSGTPLMNGNANVSDEPTGDVNNPISDQPPVAESDTEATDEPEDMSSVPIGSVVEVPNTPRIGVEAMPDPVPFTEANFDVFLRYILSSFRGDRLIDVIDIIDRIEQTALDGDQTFQSVGFSVDGFTRVLECPDGGRYLAGKWESTSVFNFRDCDINGLVLNGGYTIALPTTDSSATSSSVIYRFRNYQLSDNGALSYGAGTALSIQGSDGQEILLSGSYFERLEGAFKSYSSNELVLRTVIEGTTYLETFGFRVTQNTGASESPEGELYGTSFERLRMSFDSGDSGVVGSDYPSQRDEPVFIADMTMPISRPIDEPYPNSGQLNIFQEGIGSFPGTLIMQLDNSDPDSFDIFIDDSGDSIVSLVIPWSEAYALGVPRSRLVQRSHFAP